VGEKFAVGRTANSKFGSALRGCTKERRLILNVHNNSCAVCGIKHNTETNRLQLHHVEPLKITHNNDITNIIPVCEACHKKLHSVPAMFDTKFINTGITI